MYWIARLTNGTSVTNKPDKRGKPIPGKWQELMDLCKYPGKNILDMSMPLYEGVAIALPQYADGYWHAYGVHALQGGGVHEALGIGWVDEYIHITWTNGKNYWEEEREIKGGEQIIWNDW